MVLLHIASSLAPADFSDTFFLLFNASRRLNMTTRLKGKASHSSDQIHVNHTMTLGMSRCMSVES